MSDKGGVRWRWRRREKPRNRPHRRCSEEIVQRMRAAMAVSAVEPRRKSRRANVVLNFDRKTAADFSGGWSIRLEPLPNRLSANKFPCQTSYERRSRRFLRVGQGWICAAGNGMESSNVYESKENVRLEKKNRKKERSMYQCMFVSMLVDNIKCTIILLLYYYNITMKIQSKCKIIVSFNDNSFI